MCTWHESNYFAESARNEDQCWSEGYSRCWDEVLQGAFAVDQACSEARSVFLHGLSWDSTCVHPHHFYWWFLVRQNRIAWLLKPKLHMFQHMLKRCLKWRSLATNWAMFECMCMCVKGTVAAFWGHNTRHWSCFSEEDSIGILKHIARHVSGKQCEGYIIKVAQLRPDFRKLKLYDICMKDPWISLQFCSFGQVESCWETHEEEPLCAVHMFDHFCMQVCSKTALVYVFFLNFCAGLMWMRRGNGDDRPRVEKVSGERLFKWSRLTCT